MLQNPDMMPNATINRWIENIKMFHFTLKHVAGVTFGPDGLSRRMAFPGDDKYEDIDESEEASGGPPEVIIEDPDGPALKDIDEFVKSIDSRGGYYSEVFHRQKGKRDWRILIEDPNGPQPKAIEEFDYNIEGKLAVEPKDFEEDVKRACVRIKLDNKCDLEYL
jgi:hypothetical protein